MVCLVGSDQLPPLGVVGARRVDPVEPPDEGAAPVLEVRRPVELFRSAPSEPRSWSSMS